MTYGLILTALFGVGTPVSFMALRQSVGTLQSLAVFAFGGAGLTLTSFFLLPWVDVRGGLNSLASLISSSGLPISPDLVRQLEQMGVMPEINRVASETLLITGWKLAAELPTVSTSLQISLFMGPVVALLALIVGGLAISGQAAAKPMGLFLLVASLLALALLFFSFRYIRAFGVDPGFFSPVFDLLGIRLGLGVWVELVGLASTAAAGLLIAQSSLKAPKRVQGRFQRRFR
ncbi:MAG: hypothetical protein WCI67_00030 [Chloroflexales bacterium]